MISVILPSYNRALFLRRSVTSIATQTLVPDELIVVDDGSIDDTAQVVSACAAEFSSLFSIRYLYQPNRGAAAARNTGIMAAANPVLCFLDSDDWWTPRKLELQYASMQRHPEYLLSHTREIWYRCGKRVNQKKKHDPPHGDVFAPSLRMCMIGMSTVMMKKESCKRFGLFDERLPCCEDYDLWLRMSCKIPFLLVPEALTCKDGGREDQLSVIHRLGMDVYRITSLCRLLEDGCLNPVQRELTVAELERKCRIYGNGCIKHGRLEEGEQYLQLPGKYL